MTQDEIVDRLHDQLHEACANAQETHPELFEGLTDLLENFEGYVVTNFPASHTAGFIELTRRYRTGPVSIALAPLEPGPWELEAK